MTWAGSHADAWATANQLVLYLAAAGVAALVPWTPRTLALVAGLWSLGVAVLCAGRLITWLGASDLLRFFTVDGRLNDPIGYPNATAALPALALSVALVMASTRTIPAAVRALALPIAVFLAEFAVLPESRGAILGALVALPVLVALAPDRGRLLVRLAVVAALVAPAASSLVAFGSAPENDRPPGPALDHAATWIATSVAAALLLGIALTLLDGRVRGPRLRVTRRGVAVAGALVVVAFAAVAAVYGQRAYDWAHDTWTAQGTPESEGRGRLLSLAPEERPDYARVAWAAFRDHPAAGVGAGNFGRVYDERRHLEKHSLYPHNLWLRAASEGGIVGLALLLGLVGALGWGLASAWRGLGPTGRALAAAAAAMGAYFCVHASLDWLEEFPALVLPALGLPFAVLALPAAASPRRAGRGLALRALAYGAAAALVAALVVSLGAAYLSERYLERARSTWSAAPQAANDDLDRAAKWDPWSPVPAQTQGALALQLGQYKRARRAFHRALAREEGWFSYLELALLEGRDGRFGPAGRLLERAAALDAKDPVITAARAKIAHRERPDPAAINALALDTPLFRR